MDLNKVILCGRLTKDIEVKYLQNGTALGNFSLAVNRRVKKNEQWIDEAMFIECAMFGKLVESLQQYLVKGKQVNIVGELKQDRWQDQQGVNHSKHSIVVEDIQMLGSKDSNQQGFSHPQGYQQQPQWSQPQGFAPSQNYGQNKIAPQSQVSYNNGFTDDIPF